MQLFNVAKNSSITLNILCSVLTPKMEQASGQCSILRHLFDHLDPLLNLRFRVGPSRYTERPVSLLFITF